ncbi:VIT family protein [Thalassovita gelatinovora]|uniref:VIT family protein n=1 Tax=Thalassovita gelatinovora TaxID=53501 RepID=A0A0N7LUQ2_THAGE|nr:VIT family protein [Thalassovita gelatinovora]QIZ80258.1 VIT family protein [Thalassovita gelatinovora]CUH64130.1 VIT family protein [Thalassovita gelatinovora]SEQ84032.1 Predicted Fe2+/Mn2+ transporter, VIT1/CCC1 family [Thalassovita gelatinovora]
MPKEGHYINRSSWLRASILGANDGIVSTASLLVGVLAAGMDRSGVLLTGLAGLTAGAFSMAAGEYVSVSAQSDTEAADLARELIALEEDPEYELYELSEGLRARGVSSGLALQVAREMTEHDALDAHAREELGLTEMTGADPLEAAIASALAFALGGVLPLAGAVITPNGIGMPVIAAITMLALALLGALGAWLGGAPKGPGVVRVLFWGGLAMAVTFVVGLLFGVAT